MVMPLLIDIRLMVLYPYPTAVLLWLELLRMLHNELYNLSNLHITWNDKVHSIKTVYNSLDSTDGYPTFLWFSRIWDSLSVPKKNLFMWKVLKNGILSLHKLKSFGIIQSDICFLCGTGVETVSHLFFECEFTFHIWNKLLHHYGYHRPMRISPMEWYNIFKATRWKNERGCLMLRILKKALYFIWMERNIRVFKGQSSSKHVMVLSIIRSM